MRYSVGIDLGSTTTKAFILGEDGQPLGRGITNSRSNYAVAAQVALAEALIDARFGLVAEQLDRRDVDAAGQERLLAELQRRFREQQYLRMLERFGDMIRAVVSRGEHGAAVGEPVETILLSMAQEAPDLFAEGAKRKSDFFRDLAGSRYMHVAEKLAREQEADFDVLVGLFDKVILEVENTVSDAQDFETCVSAALAAMPTDGPAAAPVLQAAVGDAGGIELTETGSVGTGYGRATLPFPKESIRSEILCHGLGAHVLFPGTRTVLDIGGQDTKAIQVDDQGIVTSFQMNDRCAAGCGRYLGYIADEMNLGLHELGPMACESKRPVRINSTCTVFAGAELRERLSLGQRREDILAGLHRAIILRAMSLLARSGGVNDEFTFTGGVAKNPAAVNALTSLIEENYGERCLNISPDSIYTGALGAALFARREWLGSLS
ncbi:MAG: benzoyl-CoA reductase subunit A [Planctomycetota bacterium]|jgi:benzoyl-CoA reductase subunit A